VIGRVLLTGAAGAIGTALRVPLRAAAREVVLSDIAPVTAEADNEIVRPADLADFDAVLAAAEGAEAIVHLGGISVEAPFEELAGPNLFGAYHVFEAARQAGVQRVVFASSNHATGFYPSGQRLVGSEPVRPDSLYGVTKAYGEALGRMYHDKFGLRVACLRIGSFRERPRNARMLSTWLSPADGARLVLACLTSPELRFSIVYGVSANQRSWWAAAPGRRLGYEPQDDAEAFAAEVTGTVDGRQGAEFATRERHPAGS
jgi:uronate dehydrogenase